MAVTLLYRPHRTPQGTIREAAVYATLEEALMQAGWDLHCGGNRDPDSIVAGAWHGSPNWAEDNHEDEQESAHDQEAKVLAGRQQIRQAATVVRRHFIVHPDDVADQSDPRGHGRPRQPADEITPSPSVDDCLAELGQL